MNATIKVGAFDYQIGKLNALQQFHITRRLGPILAAMGVPLLKLKMGSTMDLEDFAPLLGPVSDMMAKMSNEDSEYIIFTCQSGGRY